jgi:uncharacterized membrane protein HdeD (DUF308 family)
MKRLMIAIGVVLLILGVAGLVHPSFTYHKNEEVAKVGPIHATVDQEKTATVPMAISALVLVAGIGLVAFGAKAVKK